MTTIEYAIPIASLIFAALAWLNAREAKQERLRVELRAEAVCQDAERVRTRTQDVYSLHDEMCRMVKGRKGDMRS